MIIEWPAKVNLERYVRQSRQGRRDGEVTHHLFINDDLHRQAIREVWNTCPILETGEFSQRSNKFFGKSLEALHRVDVF